MEGATPILKGYTFAPDPTYGFDYAVYPSEASSDAHVHSVGLVKRVEG